MVNLFSPVKVISNGRNELWGFWELRQYELLQMTFCSRLYATMNWLSVEDFQYTFRPFCCETSPYTWGVQLQRQDKTFKLVQHCFKFVSQWNEFYFSMSGELTYTISANNYSVTSDVKNFSLEFP